MTKHNMRIVLTFDLDAETLWTSRGTKQRVGPVELSQGIYGPEVGIPRILKLLKKHNIHATFFITGFAAERYSIQCRQIVDEGHEIGHHNYWHEWPNRTDEKDERAAFTRAIDTLKKLTGKKPTGYRAPGWELSDITMDLLLEHGFSYSSNMMDGEKPYEFTVDGKDTGIVELPCSWLLDDAAFFMHGLNYGAPMFPAAQVFEQWRLEFDAMNQLNEGQVYVLTMHPQIIGRPSRILLLDQLIGHIRDTGNARFYRADELTEEVLSDSGRKKCDYNRYLWSQPIRPV